MKKIFLIMGLIVILWVIFIVDPTSAYAYRVDDITNYTTPVISLEEDYIKTNKTSVKNYNGIPVSNLKIYSDVWANGLIGHRNKYSSFSIEKIEGVYAHFQFYGKSVLESGNCSFNYNESNTVTILKDNSLIFSKSLSVAVTNRIYAGFGLEYAGLKGGADTSLSISNELSRVIEYKYTREETTTQTTDSSIVIDKTTAKYCPDGCSISIGLVGTYYKVRCMQQEEKNWWGHWYKVGTGNIVSFVIVNEPVLSYHYVAYKGANSDDLYYKK